MRKISLCIMVLSFCSVLTAAPLFAFEETITVPAEKSEGVLLDLKKGEYLARIDGGAITLFYPINPNYRWLIGVAAGTDVKGGQDEPNLGTVYFEPKPAVYSQAEAEQQAIKAAKENIGGTFMRFTLKEDKKVRFWVSDFDYSDNNGMVKLKVSSVSK